MSGELFRTCPESGLQFHKPAEQLMRAFAVLAVVILLIAVGRRYGCAGSAGQHGSADPQLNDEFDCPTIPPQAIAPSIIV